MKLSIIIASAFLFMAAICFAINEEDKITITQPKVVAEIDKVSGEIIYKNDSKPEHLIKVLLGEIGRLNTELQAMEARLIEQQKPKPSATPTPKKNK